MSKKYLMYSGIVLVGIMLFTPCLFAQPQSRPNGPYVEAEQGTIALSSFMTNEELYSRLEKLAAKAEGVMELELVGYSDAINGDLMEELGWPIYLCKFGEPDPSKMQVLITTQIHGNEVIGTEAMLQIMEKLAAGGAKEKEILKNVTLWVLPRINPDGAMNEFEGEWLPDRQTHQVWDPEFIGLPAGTRSPWYYDPIGSVRLVTEGTIIHGNPGYDENRDSNPNLAFRIENLGDYGFTPEEFAVSVLNNSSMNNSRYGGYYVTPEARIVTDVYLRLNPDVYIDIHHRGFNYLSEDDNRQVYIQIAAEVAEPYTDPFTGNYYEVDSDVLELAKQVNFIGWQSLQLGNSAFGAIQKYPKVNLPGTTLGSFALNDSAIMLIEIAGQTQNLGQKANGRLAKTVTTSVFAILDSMADGSVYDVDPFWYDEIPEAANRMSDPTVRDDDLF